MSHDDNPLPNPQGQSEVLAPAPCSAPYIGSQWSHRNGINYEVVAIANDPPTSAHPLSVIYRGANGKWWTRPLRDWHRSFTLKCKQEGGCLVGGLCEKTGECHALPHK